MFSVIILLMNIQTMLLQFTDFFDEEPMFHMDLTDSDDADEMYPEMKIEACISYKQCIC